MSEKILENLKKSVLQYNAEEAARWAREGIEEGLDPLKLASALTVAIRQVGERYAKGELWLPDLIGAAHAMKNAMPVLEEEIIKGGKEIVALGLVLLGTVYGDIHDIGKTMVATLLAAEGFTVKDLGVNVTHEQFIEAAKEHKPDILAMSSLLTTTAYEQKKVIDGLTREGLRNKVKVMVGGGAIDAEFAQSIGADGYDPTAPGAVKLARYLLGK